MRSLKTFIIYQNIVTNVMVNTCGMYDGNEKCIQKFYLNSERKDHF